MTKNPFYGMIVVFVMAMFVFASGCTEQKDQPKPSEEKKVTERQKPASEELVDINSAGKVELMTLPGIGEAYSQKIIDGRPYKMKTQLRTRNILPEGTYEKIADKIIASQSK